MKLKNIINFHPRPPQYRGVGCVNFAVMNNEKKTKISFML